MKISFQALFQKPLTGIRFFFIFGNEPTVFERVIAYIQKKTAVPLTIRDEGEVLSHPVSQPSLFGDQGGTFLTLVPNVTDKILKSVEQLEGIYLFTSEKARAKSKLVMAFSEMPQALAISAYASPLTSAEYTFLTQGLSLPPTVSDLLFQHYQNDYHGLLEALTKIRLYGDISSVDPTLFLKSDSEQGDISNVQKAFLLREVKKALSGCARLTPPDFIPLLRALGRAFLTLGELRSSQKTTNSLPWHALSSPVFFKDQPSYEQALRLWRQEEIHGMLEALLSFEKGLKFSEVTPSIVSHTLCERLKRGAIP